MDNKNPQKTQTDINPLQSPPSPQQAESNEILLLTAPPQQHKEEKDKPNITTQKRQSTPPRSTSPLKIKKVTKGKTSTHFTNFCDMTLHSLPLPAPKMRPVQNYFDISTTIREIINAPNLRPLRKSPWRFERTKEAAAANTARLKKYRYNPEVATQSPNNTTLTYGSEFRPISQIKKIFQHHHHWQKIREIVADGVTYPITPIPEDQRLSDIDYHIERGNHKSAKLPENAEALDKAFTKEVKYRWAIPIDPKCIKSIPHACVTPLGVATQWSINAENERIIKRRTTHDCTFPGPSGLSCNKRVISEDLVECTYGHAFTRFIHGIHAMRVRHPNHKIWINKTDMDAAYRRIHANMLSAVLCITILNDIAYLLGRLPFGSSPAPSFFSIISDAIGDVAQDLSLDPHWDPATLKSPYPIDTTPKSEPPSIDIGQADSLAVNLPDRNIVLDNFIDDSFNAGIDEGDIPLRLAHSVPLVLYSIFRPTNEADADPRNPIINFTKHAAEGKLEERKVVLGWLIDSRRFRVFLTPEKSKDWITDINTAIKSAKCTKGTLESLIGRFNHTGAILHLSRYFLTRLRHRLQVNNKKNTESHITLTTNDVQDLQLWKFIITLITDRGVSINNITITTPSLIVYSDACEWGLGGFTTQGTAWRYELTPHLQHRASINFLEFLASIVTILLGLDIETYTSNHPSVLAFSDNSSAVGWLYHSTFHPATHDHHDKLARHLARELFKRQATLHPEHIPGKHNDVADALSRDFHMTTPKLTQFLLQLPQAPPSLRIVTLPPMISSWIALTLESMPQKEASPCKQSPSSAAASAYGKGTLPGVKYSTHSSQGSPSPNANSLLLDSPTTSGPTPSKLPPNPSMWKELSVPPSRQWFRSSARTFGATPQETGMDQKGP